MSRTRVSPRRTWRRALLLSAVVAVLGVSAYHGLRPVEVADTTASGGVTTSTTAVTVPETAAPSTEPPTTTTTTEAPTTTTTSTTTTVPGPPTYRSGDSGAEVAALQVRLQELGFWLPSADGSYGSLTQQAVMAFQKHVGLGRDGIAGPATLAALATAAPVAALEGGDHLEIDLARQLLLLVHQGRTLAFNTSTGAEGWRTPPGRFTIFREVDGMREAELGPLWRPKYFNGGIAVHGSPSIPGRAASHGCARLHDAAIDMIWDTGMAPIGTPVWVY